MKFLMPSTGGAFRAIVFIALLAAAASAIAQSHKGLTFQGFLKNANGALVTTSNLTITSQVLSPNDCILVEETHAGVNIVDGFFTVVLGKGARTGGDKGLSLKEAFSNTTSRANLEPSNSCSYTPTSADARKLRLNFVIGTDVIAADFNLRANAFAVWSEVAEDSTKFNGKAADQYVQVNSGAGFTQTRLEELVTSSMSVSGGAVKWNGANFVVYNPADGANLSSNSIAGSAIVSLPFAKLTSVPTPLSQIGGLSCANGQILQISGGAWACAAFAGGGSVTSVDMSVPSFLSVSGGPVTTSGTLALSLATQATNVVFAGPSSGGAAAPTFRSLNINDIRSTNTGTFLTGTTCSAGQALVYSAVSDTISCSLIEITSSQVTTALGYTPINKSGDTMSGALNLPSNGLVAGTTQLVLSGGKVGIGTTSPDQKLTVNGASHLGNDVVLTRTDAFATASLVVDNSVTTKIALQKTGGGNISNIDLLAGTIYASGNVGIGTTAPAAPLTVSANAAALSTPASGTVAQFGGIDNLNTRVQIESHGGANISPVLVLRHSRGTAAAPSATLNGDGIGVVASYGFDGTSYTGRRSNMWMYATEDWTSSAMGSNLVFETTANGTTTATERVRIEQNGNVGIGTTSPSNKLTLGSGSIFAPESALTYAATTTVDWTTANQQTITLTGNNTINFSNYAAGQTLRLIVCQDGTGSRTLTWDVNVIWAGGSAPVLTATAGKCDVAVLIATQAKGSLKIFGTSALNF